MAENIAEEKEYSDENLIVNGSFEELNGTISYGDFGYLNSSEVPGWNVSDVMEVWTPNSRATASEGSNLIELDSDTGVDSISQTLSLNAGIYLLEFDAANREAVDSTNDFKVIFNGEEIVITSDMMSSSFTTFSYEFEVAEAGEYTLVFEEFESSNDRRGTLLDNIQLHAEVSEEPEMIEMASLLSNAIDEATIIPSGGNEEEVDLSILSNITIDEVVSMTDTNNVLEITGDEGDSISLDLGSEVLESSEITSGDMQWHKDSDDSTANQEVYVGKTSTDETVTLLINGIDVENV